MARLSIVQRNAKRENMVADNANRREKLKAIIMDKEISPEERFKATLKLAELPRNSAKVRIRNRCKLTGRSRGVYSKFGMNRIKFRDLASEGQIPGVVKSSW